MRHILFSALYLCLAPLSLQAQTAVPETSGQISLSFSPVVKQTSPAVVNIYASRVVQERVSPFANDPLFSQLFGDLGRTQPRVQNSLGSGVLVDRQGVVVSNYHVVGQATDIRVVLNDRREYAAEVMLADEQSDLAVLKLKDAKDLPSLAFANSDALEVGDLVLAIGNPFGVGQTVSQGIISGLSRSWAGLGRGYFVQTDAAINPGNSGGALIDLKGQLVGINTAILSQGGGSNGIGFAIPANLVQTVVKQAMAGETSFQRPWAGVGGQAMESSMADAMGLSRPDGVVLTQMHPESPFLKAGLEPGDVVLQVAGEPTNTPQEMIFRLAALGVGTTVKVHYLRDGKAMDADVALIAPPESPARDAVAISDNVALRGLAVAQINPAVQAELDLPLTAEGVIVTAADELAGRIGLRVGDQLLAINETEVRTTADVRAAATAQTRNWALTVLRDGQVLRMRVRL